MKRLFTSETALDVWGYTHFKRSCLYDCLSGNTQRLWVSLKFSPLSGPSTRVSSFQSQVQIILIRILYSASRNDPAFDFLYLFEEFSFDLFGQLVKEDLQNVQEISCEICKIYVIVPPWMICWNLWCHHRPSVEVNAVCAGCTDTASSVWFQNGPDTF